MKTSYRFKNTHFSKQILQVFDTDRWRDATKKEASEFLMEYFRREK